MDDSLHAHFQHVGTALGTLVDSIATYNPSTQAAVDLVAADEELSRGLDEPRHQANHARIQTLRHEADALEAQLRSSVATLATLRRELFETPATTFPKDSRPVPFDELLQYAKNISKYTVPPTYRERVPTPVKVGDDKEGASDGASGAASHAVGTPTDPAIPHAAAQGTAIEGAEGEEEAPKDVTAEEAEWLKKLNESQVPWFPWPSYDRIRESNLMQIQHLLDANKRPEEIDITKMGEEDKEQIAAEARERIAAQAAAAEVVEAPVQAAPRPAPASKPPEEPVTKFQGFDDYESD